jgi:hypothetical protein
VQLPDRTVELIEAVPHGRVTNLSARLGVHGTAALSLNGAWVAVTTDDGCAAVSTGDFRTLTKVCSVRYAESMYISDRGDVLVYSGSGSHQRDLFLLRRNGSGGWSTARSSCRTARTSSTPASTAAADFPIPPVADAA